MTTILNLLKIPNLTEIGFDWTICAIQIHPNTGPLFYQAIS
ncbi:MAG: hypothetical protein ACI8YO_002591, partial [Gammaproteobacteria bacterium]